MTRRDEHPVFDLGSAGSQRRQQFASFVEAVLWGAVLGGSVASLLWWWFC